MIKTRKGNLIDALIYFGENPIAVLGPAGFGTAKQRKGVYKNEKNNILRDECCSDGPDALRLLRKGNPRACDIA